MAYQTGTATSGTDLLQQLATFLTTAGWTVNKSQAEGSGWWISVQKGSDLFVNFVDDPATTGTTDPGAWIYMRGATGYDGGAAWTAQPNTSSVVSSNKFTWPCVGYWFFEGDDYIHVVVEVENGRFRHLQAGIIDKACTFTGGIYVMGTKLYYNNNMASNPTQGTHNFPWESENSSNQPVNNYLRADAGDGVRWFSNNMGGTVGNVIGAGIGYTPGSGSDDLTNYGLEYDMFEATPNDTNGITPLVPINVIVEKANALFVLLGQPKDVRRVSMRNYQPGDIITLGSDEWLVFPWTARSTTTNDATTDKSGYYGFAYRKNTA